MVTPAPRRPAPSASAALVRVRCRLRLGSVKPTGTPRAGTVGGFTWVSEASLRTVGVKSGPELPGSTGGGGVGRTATPPPPPPHAVRARVIAQASTESARGVDGRYGFFIVVSFQACHPPPRNRCTPQPHYANSSAAGSRCDNRGMR